MKIVIVQFKKGQRSITLHFVTGIKYSDKVIYSLVRDYRELYSDDIEEFINAMQNKGIELSTPIVVTL